MIPSNHGRSRSFVGANAHNDPIHHPESRWQAKALPGHRAVHVTEQACSSSTSISASLLTGAEKETTKSLGIPIRKKRVDPLDLLALAISVICSALALISVHNDHVASRLRVGNQLIVVGFLLSIMNLCLGRATSYFFILLEARFGRSTLQNFDGILHNQVFSTKLDAAWRCVIFCFMALPILLSVGYKRFTDGESKIMINATAVAAETPDYGLFGVPDANRLLGSGWPISIYENASVPFRLASARSSGQGNSQWGLEPQAPSSFPVPYGPNTLLLTSQSTAMLDLPRSTRLVALQESLSSSDSIEMSAAVHGTVATRYNTQAPKDDPAFTAACYNGSDGMYISSVSLVNPEGFGVHILAPVGIQNQSTFWLALAPFKNPWPSTTEQCDSLAQYARRYDITRHNCSATWSIARNGFELINGACDAQLLPPLEQAVFQMNTFYLGSTFGTNMAATLGVYSNMLPNSPWVDPAMSTFAVSIAWSAFQSLDSPSNRENSVKEDDFGFFLGQMQKSGTLGVIYEVPDEQVYLIRTTLVKSPWLDVIFVVQPVLMLISMVGAILLYSVPVDRGFGIVSVLAGVNRNTLDPLRGASLSGKLEKRVQLNVFPIHPKDGSSVHMEYRVGVPGDGLRNGRLNYETVYS